MGLNVILHAVCAESIFKHNNIYLLTTYLPIIKHTVEPVPDPSGILLGGSIVYLCVFFFPIQAETSIQNRLIDNMLYIIIVQQYNYCLNQKKDFSDVQPFRSCPFRAQ